MGTRPISSVIQVFPLITLQSRAQIICHKFEIKFCSLLLSPECWASVRPAVRLSQSLLAR